MGKFIHHSEFHSLLCLFHWKSGGASHDVWKKEKGTTGASFQYLFGGALIQKKTQKNRSTKPN